jgi:cell division protein FtsI/penicillin-binding protein 2
MKPLHSTIRIGLCFIALVMIFALFFTRLLFLQIVKGEELRKIAEHQYKELIELPAARGEIFDCKGNKVAINVTFPSLFAYPLTAEDADSAYYCLAGILQKSPAALRREYQLEPKRFRWIKRKLAAEELARYNEKMRQQGLFIREEPTRCYPFGEVGRSILGFVDIDNVGRSGIEMEMNGRLVGTPGRSMIQKDGKGTIYRIKEIPVKEAVSGTSIVLTIDWDKQQIVERELAAAVEQYKAKGGMAVFVDLRDGSILAAADCFPSEDGDPSLKPMKLESVAGVFEPGSVFKVITAAAALAEKKVDPEDRFYAENGTWVMGKHRMRDDHSLGWATFREGFEKSSNIIMGKIANEVTGDKVLAMAKRFGFGRKTRCGLNSESKGILPQAGHWSEYTTAAFAIGHGVSVTALQMAQAFAVVGSGGYLNQPYLIKGFLDSENQVIERHTSQPTRIIDDNTANILADFMRGVVMRGTAKNLLPMPFAIAGKTGTAQKPNFSTGGYYQDKYMGSFGGYFPADSPLVAGIVVLDEPEPIHYGGYTAGPTFKNIALKFAALDRYNLPPMPDSTKDGNPDEPEEADSNVVRVLLADVAGRTRDGAEYELARLGLKVEFSGSGDHVLCTQPAAAARVPEGSTVRCIMGRDAKMEFPAPDLAGLTMREAVRILNRYGLTFSSEGAGRVVLQAPPAGTLMTATEKMNLIFARDMGRDSLAKGTGKDSTGILAHRR